MALHQGKDRSEVGSPRLEQVATKRLSKGMDRQTKVVDSLIENGQQKVWGCERWYVAGETAERSCMRCNVEKGSRPGNGAERGPDCGSRAV